LAALLAYIQTHRNGQGAAITQNYIKVMSYDYDESGDSISSHHTNLNTSAGYEHLSFNRQV
jgi:hypothetical protein